MFLHSVNDGVQLSLGCILTFLLMVLKGIRSTCDCVIKFINDTAILQYLDDLNKYKYLNVSP